MMNYFFRAPTCLLLLLLIFFMVLTVSKSRRMSSHHYITIGFEEDGASTWDEGHQLPQERAAMEEVGKELYPTGSSLPDCSHACGACYPCKRVMVSFKCSAVESCPIVYKCMCKGKYYHVPSN